METPEKLEDAIRFAAALIVGKITEQRNECLNKCNEIGADKEAIRLKYSERIKRMQEHKDTLMGLIESDPLSREELQGAESEIRFNWAIEQLEKRSYLKK